MFYFQADIWTETDKSDSFPWLHEVIILDKLFLGVSLLSILAGVGLVLWGIYFIVAQHEWTGGLTIALCGVSCSGTGLVMLLTIRDAHLAKLRQIRLAEARRQALLASRT